MSRNLFGDKVSSMMQDILSGKKDFRDLPSDGSLGLDTEAMLKVIELLRVKGEQNLKEERYIPKSKRLNLKLVVLPVSTFMLVYSACVLKKESKEKEEKIVVREAIKKEVLVRQNIPQEAVLVKKEISVELPIVETAIKDVIEVVVSDNLFNLNVVSEVKVATVNQYEYDYFLEMKKVKKEKIRFFRDTDGALVFCFSTGGVEFVFRSLEDDYIEAEKELIQSGISAIIEENEQKFIRLRNEENMHLRIYREAFVRKFDVEAKIRSKYLDDEKIKSYFEYRDLCLVKKIYLRAETRYQWVGKGDTFEAAYIDLLERQVEGKFFGAYSKIWKSPSDCAYSWLRVEGVSGATYYDVMWCIGGRDFFRQSNGLHKMLDPFESAIERIIKGRCIYVKDDMCPGSFFFDQGKIAVQCYFRCKDNG